MNHINLKVYNLTHDERGKVINQMVEILKDHNEIIFAYIYGSFAEGMPFHDIDLGLYISRITEKDSMFYMLDLAQKFSSELRISVDVRVLNSAPVLYLYHVIRGTLIYEGDEEIRSSFVERIIQKYLDLKPMIRIGVKEAFAS